MNKSFIILGALAVLFLGLSLYAPPSWYEWIPTKTRKGQEFIFPMLCVLLTLMALYQIPSVAKILIRMGIFVDPSKKDGPV